MVESELGGKLRVKLGKTRVEDVGEGNGEGRGLPESGGVEIFLAKFAGCKHFLSKAKSIFPFPHGGEAKDRELKLSVFVSLLGLPLDWKSKSPDWNSL
eukprot:147557-Hanusia_phi.AAC.1